MKPTEKEQKIISTRDAAFLQLASKLKLSVNEDFGAAGLYEPLLRCKDQIFISGQLPKLNGEVAVRGTIGLDLTVDCGRHAAMICAVRCLALLYQSLGTLELVRAIPHISVYMQSDRTFEAQSAVADGASEVFNSVCGAAGSHTRTSLSVFRLPLGAAVEVDLVAIAWRESTLRISA